MQNEDFENSYTYRACQSILAGDQKSALEYAKKRFLHWLMILKPIV